VLAEQPEGREAFVEELIRQTPTVPFIACASPQFCDGATGFVMPYRQYGTAYGAYLWDDANAPPEFGKRKGDLATYQRTVLRIALSSPYVSMAIMIALAGPLVDYVEQRRGRRLLTETAIVHFVGESSSGKTTLGRVAQSSAGSPTIETDYEATDRGIAEHAYRRNNLVLVIDDTESANLSDAETLAKMLKLAHHVPRGRYKAISMKASRSDLPELRWSEYGISSGPETVAALAARLLRKRGGDRVRILDIALPTLAEGGIFGSRVTADRKPPADPARLIDELEDGLLACHGVLFDAWIKYLLAHDLADRIIDHFDRFVEATAAGSNGLERRFAMKDALPCAAGMIGVESGLLPWPDDWPMRAVRHCYENSLRQRDPEAAVVAAAVRKLARSLRSRDEFPMVVAERGQYPRWGDDQIGFHLKRGGKTETFIAKERVRLVCDPEAFIEPQVFARLLELKIVGAGSYASASEQMRVRLPSGEIVKVRLWRLNRAPLMALVGTTAAGSARAVGGDRRAPAPDAKREPPAREVAGARRPQKLF
jgi:ABC-type oligopeptide transport system ATPase subunit